MTRAEREIVAETLNLLPFVTWDRLIEIDGADLDVYGWIDREDGRSDFVNLVFPPPIAPGYVGFTTSSAKHSAEIAELLFGDQGFHVECPRVEIVLGNLVGRKTVQA